MQNGLLSGFISGAIGKHPALNAEADVRKVQYLFNIITAPGAKPLAENGICGPDLVFQINHFQLTALKYSHPDGRVDPGGRTLSGLVERARTLRGSRRDLGPFPSLVCSALPDTREEVDEFLYFVLPELTEIANKQNTVNTPGGGASTALTDKDFEEAAATLGPNISTALVHAFAEVESGGKSGFGAGGKPIIAFEGHWFRRLTNHKYDDTHPLLSYKYAKKAGPEWQKNNKDQTTAWQTLNSAMALDHGAALQSCSWGMFQVMGFQYERCGYATVDAFVDDMKRSARGHLDAFIGYCKKTSGMVTAMTNKNYAEMAKLYNGDDYGDYDKRIERAYQKHGGT